MIDIDTVLTDYSYRAQVSPLTEYPLVWSAHYGAKRLGEYGVPALPEDVGSLVLGMMMPFGLTDEVEASFLVIDGVAIPPYERKLCVSGLYAMGSGSFLTHWVVPYWVSDTGSVFDAARKDFYKAPSVHAALGAVMDRRTQPRTVDFAIAYQACLVQLKEMV